MSMGLAPAAPAARFASTERGREAVTGYLFILPSFLGFILFVLGPLVAAVVISFTKYDLLTPPEFVGLDNYARMLSDPRLHRTYINTFVYVIAAVIGINSLALVLAVMLNRRLPRPIRYVVRSAYFFPSLVALVYVSVVFQAMFQRDTGIINFYLGQLGFGPIDWLNSPTGAVASVVIVDTWRNVGFAMLIFLAALQEVPRDLEEAAHVDGASGWRTFRHIVVPLVSPAIFFNITITMIGAFQIFESIIVLTDGGPGDASRSVVMYLAERGFEQFRMGYASAIAVTLFLIIMVLTMAQFRLRRRWVFYE
jgi:multiple sugar transport system permease protein